MKTIFLSLITLLSFQAFSQINFGIGMYQNFGNIYARNSNYVPFNFNLNRSSIGATLTLSKMHEDGWYPEFKADISLISDTSTLTNNNELIPIDIYYNTFKTEDQISVPYDYNIAFYETSHQQFSFTLNRKVSKYFSLGSGLAFDLRKSRFNDLKGSIIYDWDESLDAYIYSTENKVLSVNEYTITKLALIIPFNFRFHLPFENHEFILSNSLNFFMGQNPTYQSSIFIRF